MKKSDGSLYYEYILLYTKGDLVASENVETTLRNDLGCYFELKNDSIGPLSIYLGGKVCKIKLASGGQC